MAYTIVDVNVNFFKTLSGILKVCQLVLGIICLSLIAHYSRFQMMIMMLNIVSFFLTMCVTFFVGNLLSIVACVFHSKTESQLRESLYELLYNAMGCILYFSGSVGVLVEYADHYKSENKDAFLSAGSLGLINSVLYGVAGLICQNLMMNHSMTYSASLGKSYYSFLGTITCGVMTTFILLLTYCISHKSVLMIRRSLFEKMFNGIVCFLYLSSSSYLAFAVHTFLYPLYKLTSIFQAFSEMSLTYMTGFAAGILHGYDCWLAYKNNE